MARPILCVVHLLLSNYGLRADHLSETLKAWKGRQDRIQCAKFKVIETRTYSKGSLNGPGEEEREPIPPENATFEALQVIAFDGISNLRYENVDQTWSRKRKSWVKNGYCYTWNGKDHKYLFAPSDDKFSQGSIGDTSETGNFHLAPILISYRGVNPALSLFGTHDLTAKKTAVLGDDECIVLESRPPTPGMEYEIWVNPKQDYSIKKVVGWYDRKVTSQIEIEHTQDPKNGWVPSSWTIVPFGTGKSYAAFVKEFSINEVSQAGPFDIEFPPGTYVVNDRTGAEYLINEDGSTRPIPNADKSATYEQIRNSEPGQALKWRPTETTMPDSAAAPTAWSKGNLLWIGLVGTVFVAAIVTRHLRQRARRA